MYIEIKANSNQGYIRSRNEDIILVAKELIRDSDIEKSVEVNEGDRFIIAVADGMGGHNGGDIASETVCSKLSDFFYNVPTGLKYAELKFILEKWVLETHTHLLEMGAENEDLKGMGTTLVGLLFYEGKILWINCGDSRIYRFRNHALIQLSSDHSLAAYTGNPDAPANVITNSIGAGSSVYLDIEEITGDICTQDAFLLCSDGLTDTLYEAEIESKLAQTSLNQLVNYAIHVGATDNVSACLVQINKL